jgi:hypothetical protein
MLHPHASWDCGMKDGIPNPESGSLIFETQLKLDRLAKIGKTPFVRNTTSAGGLVPIFEARVDSPYAYLNTGKFLSSNPGMANGGVKITMYDRTN